MVPRPHTGTNKGKRAVVDDIRAAGHEANSAAPPQQDQPASREEEEELQSCGAAARSRHAVHTDGSDGATKPTPPPVGRGVHGGGLT